MKPKIIFLSPVEYFKGGAERSLFDLISNPDIDPILIAPAEGEILDKGREIGLKCYVLPFLSINNIHRPFSFMKGLKAIKDLFITAGQLKKISKETGAKIVHSNGLKAHAINCSSKWLGGAKAIIHIRDIPYTKPEIIVWHILKTLCSKMILVSHACWPDQRLPSKVIVIHNGTPLIKENIGQENTSNPNYIQFGFIGRIHPAKGLHLLIDWIYAAKQNGFDIRLSIRGTFSDDAPEYKPQIHAQIKQLNLETDIEFTGFIDNAVALYQGIDIVVVPSKTPDPLPRSVMESMARGIPVFGYPAGGIFEMIEDGKTGFLVKDSESFIKAIQNLQSDAQAKYGMIEAARNKIAQEFTIDNLHQNLNLIYKNL